MKYTRVFLLAPVLVAVLTMLGATAPNVYARHLSDTQRYSDGYSNGSDAAARDSNYNVACDPTGAYTSGGGQFTTEIAQNGGSIPISGAKPFDMNHPFILALQQVVAECLTQNNK